MSDVRSWFELYFPLFMHLRIGLAILSSSLLGGCGPRPNPAAPVVATAAPAPPAAPAAGAPKPSDASPRSLKVSPAEIAARATPAIVSVRTDHSLGTGFVVGASGVIATNLHVVAGSAKLTVTFSDQREYPVVRIENGDGKRDLVLLRIGARGLPTLTLGDSAAMRPGDPIVAIGHPMGLEDTVSNGLVSAVRHVGGELTVLQLSAPISPGSSGGPVFNDRGEVIAVATALLVGAQNVSFGVPSDYLKPLIATPAPVSLDLFAVRTEGPHLPKVKREVPDLSPRIFDGCSEPEIKLVAQSIGEAVEVGAPLYDDGNFAACYHIYSGAAADLSRRLSRNCQGPVRALLLGAKKAERMSNPSEQAWALRDVFDGLVRALVRRRERRP